ncbi:GHMP kinase [Phycicoccus sp. HDW14]|nr:GHMP kinase [Phycicoccus sp. HDW14]
MRTTYRARAPLRVSFAGGGTDVPPYPEREGGAVLSSTISSYAYATLRPREDGVVAVQSLDVRDQVDFDVADPIVLDGRLDLPKAAIAGVMRLRGARRSSGFDLFLHTGAPPGSGLGSSSAVIVAVIALVSAHLGVELTPHEVAEVAARLEREDLGIRGGLQDQYAAAFGGFNFMEFHAEKVVVYPLRVPAATVHELEHNMLLAFTGSARVGDHIIEDQVRRFRDGEAASLEALRMQKEIAHAMKEALLRGEVATFGSLLGEAWTQKRRMSDRIATPQIDEAIDVALRSGALGAKVTGAGGGGHMVFVCEFERKHLVAEQLIALGMSVSEFTFSRDGVTTWRVPS